MSRTSTFSSVCVVLCLLGGSQSGCHHAGTGESTAAAPVERRVMLLAETAGPAFFLGPERTAPAVAFGSPDAKLILRGPAELGRVPVRVHGRLTLEAYVPVDLLELRAQGTEHVAGTPVLVAPNDRLRVLGPAAEPGHVRVAARPRQGADVLGPFEGTLPLASLAATEAPADASAPEPGLTYGIPARTALPLYDAPQGELIALVPAQPKAMTASVFSVEHAWLGVRVGQGPYLVGYTNEPLTLQGKPGTIQHREAAKAPSSVPRRIAETAGVLKRVANGTQVRFRDKSIAKFRSEGWARVLLERPDGVVEVLAAADELLTVRGVVRATDLTDADPALVEQLLPTSAPSEPELAPALE
jgi:hypothetical protein